MKVTSNPAVIAAIEAEWRNFLAGCTDCHGVSAPLDLLQKAYGWADRMATYYAQIFRSGHIFNFGMAAFAVTHLFGQPAITSRDPAPPPAEETLDERRARVQRPEHVANLTVYLLSDAAKDISGQIFGARGPEIYLYSQPRPVRTLFRSGGWAPSKLAEVLPAMVKNSMTPVERTGDVFSWDPV